MVSLPGGKLWREMKVEEKKKNRKEGGKEEEEEEKLYYHSLSFSSSHSLG